MKVGSPYIQFASIFRKFMEDRGYDGPSEFYRDLVMGMGKSAPSKSEVYMVFYGARLFKQSVLAFMAERYGFKVKWTALEPVRTVDGKVLKTNSMALQGMLEMRGLR